MQLWHSHFFDGGVEKTRLCLFILLSSEKNELRSSGSYRAIRLVATVAVGVCGTRSARTVLALFPPSPLRLHRPIKAGTFSVFESFSNPSVTACHLPYISLRKHPVRLRDTAGRSVRVPLCYYTDSHLPVSSGVKPLWWA